MRQLFKAIIYTALSLIVFLTIFGMFIPDILSSKMPVVIIFTIVIFELIILIYVLEFIGREIFKLWKYD